MELWSWQDMQGLEQNVYHEGPPLSQAHASKCFSLKYVKLKVGPARF